MLQFFKDSVRELKHVVWPTHAETRKYLVIVIVVLALFGLYLFIASTVFSEILYGMKDIVNPDAGNQINIGDIQTGDIQVETVEGTDVSTETEVETPVVDESTQEAQ
jgi:preprotein translocase SecE subunit